MFQKLLTSFLILALLLTSAPAFALKGESPREAGLDEVLTRALQNPAKAIQRFSQFLAVPPAAQPLAAGMEERPDSEMIRYWVADLNWPVGSPRYRDAVRDLVSAGDASVPYLVEILRKTKVVKPPKPRERVLVLENEEEDGPGNVSRGAMESLGKIRPVAQEAVPVLLQFLRSPEDDLRQMAMRTLGQMGLASDVVVSSLVPFLDSQMHEPGPSYIDAARVRDASDASEVLARLGKPAVPALIEALRNWNSAMRRNAAFTLGEIGSQAAEAVQALIKVLGDRDWEVRAAAAEALGRMGRAAAGAIPELKRLKQSHPLDYFVRHDDPYAFDKANKAAVEAELAFDLILRGAAGLEESKSIDEVVRHHPGQEVSAVKNGRTVTASYGRGVEPSGLEENGNAAVVEAGRAIREMPELRTARATGSGYLLLDRATVAAALTIPTGGLEESEPLSMAAVVNPAQYHTLMAIAEASGMEESEIRQWANSYLFRYFPGDPLLTEEYAIGQARGALALRLPSTHITILDTLSQVMSEFGRAIDAILRSFGITLDSKKLRTLVSALYHVTQA